MKISASTLLALLILSCGLVACSDDTKTGLAEEAAQAAVEAAEAAEATANNAAEEVAENVAERAEAVAQVGEAAEAGEPVVTGDSFRLEASAVEGYTAGELAQFGIQIEGRGEWHVNEAFPFSVQLTGPDGVSFPKERLTKDDAAEFREERVQLDVPFTASAGTQAVQARVAFAMCNPQTCVPETHTVALNLAVQ